MSGWQPIVTAPRGPEPILIACRADDEWFMAVGSRLMGTDLYDDGDQVMDPTHWMPLPAPPLARSGD